MSLLTVAGFLVTNTASSEFDQNKLLAVLQPSYSCTHVTQRIIHNVSLLFQFDGSSAVQLDGKDRKIKLICVIHPRAAHNLVTHAHRDGDGHYYDTHTFVFPFYLQGTMHIPLPVSHCAVICRKDV